MTTSIQRVTLSREKDECRFLDDGFTADREAATELSVGRFQLLEPGSPRITDAQPSAFGELYRERISFGAAYCQANPPFKGFRIDVDHDACVVQVTVRIALTTPGRLLHVPQKLRWACSAPDDPGTPWEETCNDFYRRSLMAQIEAKKPAWKRVIEETWSERFVLIPVEPRSGLSISPSRGNPRAPWSEGLVPRNVGEGSVSNCESYLIRVAVEWVDPASLQGSDLQSENNWDTRVDYIVAVQFGSARDSMKYWHIDMWDATVAHEFGHMLGNPDEYDRTCDGCPSQPIVDGSIMNNHLVHPNGVRSHHFFLVSYWMWTRTCTSYAISRPGWHARGGGIDVGDFGIGLVDIGSWWQRNIDCP